MTHAERRLRERYSPDRPALVMAKVTKEVAARRGKLVRPLRGGRELWEVFAFGQRVRAVWDVAGRMVITVLPARRRERRAV